MALNKVTVRIRMPTDMGVIGWLATQAGVGHASLTLRCSDSNYYITWMAHGSPFAGLELEPYSHIDNFTKRADKQNMRQFFNSNEPTHKIKLKTKQPGSVGDGLDAEQIKTFWEDRLSCRPKYAFSASDRIAPGALPRRCVRGASTPTQKRQTIGSYRTQPASWPGFWTPRNVWVP